MTNQLKFIKGLVQARAAADTAIDIFYKERTRLFRDLLNHWYEHGYHLLDDDAVEVQLLDYTGHTFRPGALPSEMYIWLTASSAALEEFTANPYPRRGEDTVTCGFTDRCKIYAELDTSCDLRFRFDYELGKNAGWKQFIKRQHLTPCGYVNSSAVTSAREAIRQNENFLTSLGRYVERLDGEISALEKELEGSDGE